jgi:hypothetical protein
LHHNSSIISDAYASSIGESFKPIRQKLPHNLLRFSSRYVIDFVRRNRIRVFVSVILVLVIEFRARRFNVSIPNKITCRSPQFTL